MFSFVEAKTKLFSEFLPQTFIFDQFPLLVIRKRFSKAKFNLNKGLKNDFTDLSVPSGPNHATHASLSL